MPVKTTDYQPQTEKREPLNFELVKELDNSQLFVDFELGLVKVVWFGTVKFETAKQLLTLATDLIILGNCNKLLLDRRELMDFATEAKVWIRYHYWPSRERKLISHLYKFAAIGSVAPKESFFDIFVSERVKRFFPSLKAFLFDTEEEAIKWLL